MRRSIVALAALMLLSAGCTNGSRITVEAIFTDVGDLVERSSVQSSDVRIGTVEKISLDGHNARVRMSIDRNAAVPGNAVALIRSTSLLGEKFVDLGAPAGRAARGRLRDGQVIGTARTGKVAGLDDALLKLGQILEGGDIGDLGIVIDSAAEIVRGKEQQLGELFVELRKLTGTISAHAPEIGSAIDHLDTAFSAFAATEDLGGAIASSAMAADILATQQQDLDSLLRSLDTFAAASAAYTSKTTSANDATLKNVRLILDEAMKTTGDIDKALSSLARYTDLWPKAIPGDYIQLDVVLETGDASGPASQLTSGRAGADRARSDLRSLLWRPIP